MKRDSTINAVAPVVFTAHRSCTSYRWRKVRIRLRFYFIQSRCCIM